MAKKIEINEASRDELAELPGIGSSTADTLIKLRDERGGFKNVAELEEVPGIGAQTLKNIRSRIAVSSEASSGRTGAEDAAAPAEAGAKAVASNGEAAAEKVVEATRAQADTVREAASIQADTARRVLETGKAEVVHAVHEVVEVQQDALGAMREAQEVWLGVVQEQISANVETARRLVACRTPQEFANVQVEYLRGSVERFVHGSARVAAPASHLFGGMWSSPGAWQNLTPRF